MATPSNDTQTSEMTSNKLLIAGEKIWIPPILLRREDSVLESRAHISVQADRMKELYPHFKVVFRNSWGIAWKGFVKPASKKYEILILCTPGCDLQDISIAAWPVSVFVTSGLQRRENAPNEPIPHLYRCTQFHHLCLYHPKHDAWNQYQEYIAEDIVLWASQWLLTYEFWHITGEWVAPGAHPENREKTPREEEQVDIKHITPTQRYKRYIYTIPLLHHMTYILPPIVITSEESNSR